MTNPNPITPPPELAKKLWDGTSYGAFYEFEAAVADAYRAGADAELEACCALMDDWGLDAADLRAARRPEPTADDEEPLWVTAMMAMDSTPGRRRDAMGAALRVIGDWLEYHIGFGSKLPVRLLRAEAERAEAA